jgi:hypothetical protein
MASTLIVGIVALVSWLCTDRIVYRGTAYAIHNNMKQHSTDTRTVTVVFNKPVCGMDTMIATVPLEQAAVIERRTGTSVTVTVRCRSFGSPRVTSLSI